MLSATHRERALRASIRCNTEGIVLPVYGWFPRRRARILASSRILGADSWVPLSRPRRRGCPAEGVAEGAAEEPGAGGKSGAGAVACGGASVPAAGTGGGGTVCPSTTLNIANPARPASSATFTRRILMTILLLWVVTRRGSSTLKRQLGATRSSPAVLASPVGWRATRRPARGAGPQWASGELVLPAGFCGDCAGCGT
jgi:hypothetical protein